MGLIRHRRTYVVDENGLYRYVGRTSSRRERARAAEHNLGIVADTIRRFESENPGATMRLGSDGVLRTWYKGRVAHEQRLRGYLW